MKSPSIWYSHQNPKSAYSPLTHTTIHQLNPAELLVHLQRQYNPTGLSVRSQALSGIHPQSYGSPCAFTGMHLQSHWAPYAFTGMYLHTTPQSRCPPHPLSPIPGSIFWYFISYKRQHDPACVFAMCGVQSSGIFVVLWPTCVMLSRCVSSPVATDCPSSVATGCPSLAGPAWSSLTLDLYGSGRHESESGIRTVPLPGTLVCAWLDNVVWTLVFGWPQLGLTLPVQFPSWSRYILGSGVELN